MLSQLSHYLMCQCLYIFMRLCSCISLTQSQEGFLLCTHCTVRYALQYRTQSSTCTCISIPYSSGICCNTGPKAVPVFYTYSLIFRLISTDFIPQIWKYARWSVMQYIQSGANGKDSLGHKTTVTAKAAHVLLVIPRQGRQGRDTSHYF